MGYLLVKEIIFSMRWFRDIQFIKPMTLKKFEKKWNFLTISNMDLDEAPCDMYHTKGLLTICIGLKSLK